MCLPIKIVEIDKNMGPVYADVESINGEELALARRHVIGEEEIKRIHVNILVDTGSYMLAINENIKEQLQLPVVETRKAQTATGHIVECESSCSCGAKI